MSAGGRDVLYETPMNIKEFGEHMTEAGMNHAHIRTGPTFSETSVDYGATALSVQKPVIAYSETVRSIPNETFELIRGNLDRLDQLRSEQKRIQMASDLIKSLSDNKLWSNTLRTMDERYKQKNREEQEILCNIELQDLLEETEILNLKSIYDSLKKAMLWKSYLEKNLPRGFKADICTYRQSMKPISIVTDGELVGILAKSEKDWRALSDEELLEFEEDLRLTIDDIPEFLEFVRKDYDFHRPERKV